MKRILQFKIGVGLLLILFLAAAAYAGTAVDPPTSADGTAWWVWAVILFVVTFVMGILAVLAGVGGGVLFVPIISVRASDYSHTIR